VLPGKKVEVASRYKLIPRSVPAEGARVRVFRPDGRLLVEGRTDEQGKFLFSYEKVESLRVEVYQDGHLAEARLAAAALGNPSGAEPATRPQPGEDPADSHWREDVKDVLVGVGFLLAAGAFVLSLRNARRLRDLKKTLEGRAPSPPSTHIKR
jgi:hypothetical protein